MKLKRYSKDPILSPNADNDWEDLVVTNPAAYYDSQEKCVYMLYRAAGKDPVHEVHLGLAKSYDGYNFERCSDKPAMSPLRNTFDGGAIEDPRLVKFGEWYYLTYACRPFLNGQYWVKENKEYAFTPEPNLPRPFSNNGMNTAVAFSKDLKTWIRAGLITNPYHSDHDVILFPEKINDKYIYLHRPIIGSEPPGIWIAETDNPLMLENSKPLLLPQEEWEGRKIGANAPPIKTELGWLVIYHGVSKDGFYRLGFMLLELDNPSNVLYNSKEPIFEPEEWYELKGCHNFNGVVFPCGNVVIDNDFIVYYGAADKYIGVAHCKYDELIMFLKNEIKK